MPHLPLRLENANGCLILRPDMGIDGFTVVFTTRVALDARGPRFRNYGFYGMPGAAAARRRLCEALGLKVELLTVGEQVHSTAVATVDESIAGCGGLHATRRLPATDGLITALTRSPLAVMTADCVPVLLADPVRRAAAAVHAGWRGSMAGILKTAVQAMRRTFSSRPRDLIAFLGPHIRSCCYRVGRDLAGRIEEKKAIRTRDTEIFLDLGIWNESLLKQEGILKKNIFISDLCTSCHTEMFFSYRADQVRKGSNASLIAITKTG